MSCRSSFCILDLSPMLDTYDLELYCLILWVVFFLSWWCPLIHKSFNFHEVRVHLFSSFCRLCFGVVSKEQFANPKLQQFTSVFSSRSFIVLALTFRSVTRFHFVFCVWYVIWFLILLHVNIKLSQYHLLKRLFFLSWIEKLIIKKL